MKFIPNAVTRQAFRSVLVLKKNSPNIMFAGGLVGTVASTVMACRATLKLSEQLPEMKADLQAAKERSDDPNEQGQALARVYVINAGKVMKLYGPSVLVGGVSIGALTGSHVQLTRRNAGLTAAYAALSKAYDEYRDRVSEEVGYDKELDLYHSAKDEKIENEDGKKEKIKVADPNSWSTYARFFDECSKNWQKNAELNRLFIQCQQTYANDLLRSRGHIFLNEVYDMLGFERTKAGQVVGWVISKDGGDNFVDFGLFEAANSRFINGWERSVLLDFNVDGVIYDKI